jgi:hypothetical protein
MKSRTQLLLTLTTLTATAAMAPAHGATLATVPMQGGMVMPMVAYHADSGQLTVTMPTEVPQLTPLLVSHPGDGFDPTHPWFDCLDPARRGLSFSRRYGFVMDTMTDLLPLNTSIWIRKLEGPAELEFYRYSGSTPQAWEPIFGTAGTPNALPWNGMMFHPGVAAPPGTNSLTAIFELFLVDNVTGLEITGAGSGPLLLQWTNVPDGRPALDIALKLIVAWPATTTGYVLESADTATATEWTIVTNSTVALDNQKAVVLPPDAVTRFYRMRSAP